MSSENLSPITSYHVCGSGREISYLNYHQRGRQETVTRYWKHLFFQAWLQVMRAAMSNRQAHDFIIWPHSIYLEIIFKLLWLCVCVCDMLIFFCCGTPRGSPSYSVRHGKEQIRGFFFFSSLICAPTSRKRAVGWRARRVFAHLKHVTTGSLTEISASWCLNF